jgi:hypothetical protein
VNPDEVVAVGAAVQAGVLSGDVKDLVLLDVTPLSLGVETLGGVMTVMIGRNTTIPTQKKEIFSTATDNQPSVEVHVLQGERTEARYNRTLGKFHLEGIMPAPRGVPKVEVTFDIDANGILSVHAKDTATGKDQKITITANSGLSDNDIQRMVKEASEHEAEDKKRREEIERRNKLDNLCYTLEKTSFFCVGMVVLREIITVITPPRVSTPSESGVTSRRTPEAVIVMRCSPPVSLSRAETFRMPFASMSKVTSTCGMPRGAGGIPVSWNLPIVRLSRASSRSPCSTWISTVV